MLIEKFLTEYKMISSYYKPTYIQIAGYPRWENVWSNILSFYLADGVHGMNGFLTKCISNVVGFELGNVISVEREVYTNEGKRIDIFIQTDSKSLFIENKVDAVLNNDLPEYLEYCRLNADEKEAIGIVLSKNKESIKENCIYNITYPSLVSEIEKEVRTILFSADRQYFAYFLDFIMNIKSVLEGNMEYNKEFYEIYANNKEKIINIVDNYNNILSYSNQKANEYADIFRNWPIKMLDKIWIFEKTTTVIDLKERNNDLKLVFDLSISPDGVMLSIHNRKKKNNDKDIIGSICSDVQEEIEFNNGRYWAKKRLSLSEIDKIESEYFPIINSIISKYTQPIKCSYLEYKIRYV